MVKRSVSTHAIVGFLFMLDALLAALGCGGNLSSHSDVPRAPVWKQNASQLAGDAANAALGQRRLLFLDNGHLLVAMQRPVTGSEGAPALFTLTLQVLDAQSGQRVYGPLKLSAQIISYHSDFGVTSAADGGFYLMLPKRIERYSPTLNLVAARDLTDAGPEHQPHARQAKTEPKTHPIDLILSPGGPLLLVSEDAKDPTKISGRWLAPDNLDNLPLPAFDRKVEAVSNPTYVFVVRDGLVWNSYEKASLQPKMMREDERPLCPDPLSCRVAAQAPGLFLADMHDQNQKRKPTVRDESGNLVWNPDEDWTMQYPKTVVGARSAPVFAYNIPPGYLTAIFNGLGNVYGRRGSSRIKVLDVEKKKTVANFLPQEFDPEVSQPMELELSPSGKQIALVSGEMVLLYPVP
jgi:hypothetical protein